MHHTCLQQRPAALYSGFYPAGRPGTPASTQKYYAENSVFERDQFEDKLRKATSLHQQLNCPQEAEDLHVATPNTHYCQLCQDKFEDYHVHSNSHAHRLRMTSSEGALLLR